MSFTIHELMQYPAYTGGPSVSQVLKDLHLQRNKVDTAIAKIDALPEKVPVTVQGASEQFITTTMGQVNANNNALANTTNALNVQYRDNVKAHVTAESDRVIAAE